MIHSVSKIIEQRPELRGAFPITIRVRLAQGKTKAWKRVNRGHNTLLLCWHRRFHPLMVVSEPHRFLPESKGKKKKVGSVYWGIYEGCAVESPEELRTIELKKSTRKEKYIAGSTTYALGRGVNMSGK